MKLSTVKKTNKFGVYELPLPARVVEAAPDSFEEALASYEQTFKEFPTSLALANSLDERKASTDPLMKGGSMIYGELVDLSSIFAVFGAIIAHRGAFLSTPLHFCDIGSGTGRVVVAAALYSNIFHPCVGVELMHGLYNISAAVKDIYDANNSNNFPSISFVHGSLLDKSVYDWTKCDVVFANSTCFEEMMMEEIGDLAKAMQTGAVFVSLSKTLPSSAGFEVVEERREKTSWYVNIELLSMQFKELI